MITEKNLSILSHGLVVVFFFFDITEDILVSNEPDFALGLEIAAFILIAMLLWREIRARFELREQYQQERALRERLSGELRRHIEQHFTAWAFTPSEQEIAWLLLHGYSFQEIAEVRGVKEKTVRQQASVIYTKSASAGRAEFVALFLEDLMGIAHQSSATTG